MKFPGRDCTMDSAWQARLDAVLSGNHFEPLRLVTMCGPSGETLATSPGVLVYDKDGWQLRLCPDGDACVAMNKATQAVQKCKTEAWRIRTGKTGAHDSPSFQFITPADHWHAILAFANGQAGQLDGIFPILRSAAIANRASVPWGCIIGNTRPQRAGKIQEYLDLSLFSRISVS